MTKSDDGLITIPFSEIEPEEVSWLWPARVIQGKLNMLVGHPDSGKSFITLDMAARVSTGEKWPDGSGRAPLGDVIILAAEDDPADTIRPRLDAHGAELSRVHFVKGMRHPGGPRIVQLDIDYWHLESKIREVGAALVDIDPVVSFVSGKIKPNDESDVRRLLQPLTEIAARTGAAIFGIMHYNKKQDLETIQRVIGAMAWVGVPRSVMWVAGNSEKPGTFQFGSLKMNLGPKPPALVYQIEDANPGTGSTVGKLVWHDQLIDPHDLGTEQTIPSALDSAKEFLREKIPVWGEGVPGPPAKEIKAQAAALGIAPKTLRRAREELRVISKPVDGPWHWWLPNPDSDEGESEGQYRQHGQVDRGTFQPM